MTCAGNGKRQTAPDVVDLFAGAGGMSLGFKQAGFNILSAFELWEAAADTYEANHPEPVHRIDLSRAEEASALIQSIHTGVIIGGPPCQDFSSAGKRIEQGRASLTESFARIVSVVHPAYFVMENVPQARASQSCSKARKMFKTAGYGLTEIVLDASLCGVPQKRKRFFCIGALGEEDGFLVQSLASRQSEKGMTLRDYFGNSLGFEVYYRHPRSYARRAVFSIDEPAPTMRGVSRPVAPGYPGHPSDAAPISPDLHALSWKERALIQTFPPDYIWRGSKTEIEQMIGNAVPPTLAQFVAAALFSHIQTKTT